MAGFYAIAGSSIVYYLILNHRYEYITLESSTFKLILLTAGIVLTLSVLTAYFLTYRKAHRAGETVWNQASKRMIFNFLIPLLTGGVFIMLLISNKIYGLIGPVSLIFYGLACVNASKFTLRDIHYLGICQIIVGLFATAFPGNSLFFWAFGFGVLHILYGTIMHFKYDVQKSE
jgi:hypothetical protein